MHNYFKYNAYLESSVNSILKIDILNNKKFVFCARTVIKTHNKNIEYRILKDLPINQLHKDVIDFIILLKSKINIKENVSPNYNKTINKKINSKDKYFITEEELSTKLIKLSVEYLNDCNKWITILC